VNKVLLAGGAFLALATSTLAIGAQTLAGASAPAGPPRQPPHELTFAEFKADADQVWNRLDVNHDGRIDQSDRDARLLEHFAQWDTNHDGMVSKDEFLAHVHAQEAGWKAHEHHGPDGHGPDGMGHDGPPLPGGPDHMGPHGGPDGMGDHHHGRMMAMAIIGPAMHDAGQNGVITRVAFDTAIKARFDKIDTNHDGKLSHEEMRAARSEHGEEHWGHHGDRHHGDWHHGDHPHGDTPPPPPAPAGQ